MYCTQCGYEIAKTTKFCPNCGSKVESLSDSENNNEEILISGEIENNEKVVQNGIIYLME